MERSTYPLIDYRTFLSDTGAGIITLISMIIIFIKKHPDVKCNSSMITEICEIFNNLKINEIPSNATLIIMLSILFITPLIGFIINAASYLFLNWFLKKLSDNLFFNSILKSIGVKNYLTIKYESEDIKNMDCFLFFQKYDIRKFNNKDRINNFDYSNFFDDIRINLISKTSKYTVSQYDRILGGLNMCRNCTFIIIIDLYVILYIYHTLYFSIAILLSFLLYVVLARSLFKKFNEHILAVFLIYLISLPIFTFRFINIKHNFAIDYIFELILFTEFFLLLTIFLSGFFIVYTNHDIYKCSKIYLEKAKKNKKRQLHLY